MKSFDLKIIIALLSPLLMMWGCQTAEQEATPEHMNTRNESFVPSVEVEHPQKRIFEGDLNITGSVIANKKVKLHAAEGGILKSITVDIGDYIKKGAIIARLYNPEMQHHFRKAEAHLKAKSEYYHRLKAIYDKTPDLITAGELDNAEADYETAMAEKAGLEERISMLNVTAPFSGFITERNVDPGAVIQNGINNPSASPIVELQDIYTVRLVVEYPESDIRYLNKKAKLDIKFPEIEGKSFTGTISRMSPALNKLSKTMRVEIDLKNTDLSLKPGMYGTISMGLKSAGEVYSVKKQALTSYKEQLYIFRVKNDIAERISVKTGLEDKLHIEIRDAQLSESDLIITQGKGLINEGMKVAAKLKSN